MNTLREAVRTCLDMRRGLGFKLRDAGRALIDFVAFLEQHHASYITQSLALAWAQQPSHTQPAHWAQRLSFARGFARYRSATDPRTLIPAQGLLPFQPKRARPFLYSDYNIRSLLRTALRMECRYERSKLRPWVYSSLFGLLSVSGPLVWIAECFGPALGRRVWWTSYRLSAEPEEASLRGEQSRLHSAIE